jgi:small subunit ribosomal protein S20
LPSHKSNFKRMKTSAKERERNRAYRSNLRAVVKEVRTEKDKTEAAKKYAAATRLLDRAAARGLIHKRTAARNKSRLALFIQKLG